MLIRLLIRNLASQLTMNDTFKMVKGNKSINPEQTLREKLSQETKKGTV